MDKLEVKVSLNFSCNDILIISCLCLERRIIFFYSYLKNHFYFCYFIMFVKYIFLNPFDNIFFSQAILKILTPIIQAYQFFRLIFCWCLSTIFDFPVYFKEQPNIYSIVIFQFEHLIMYVIISFYQDVHVQFIKANFQYQLPIRFILFYFMFSNLIHFLDLPELLNYLIHKIIIENSFIYYLIKLLFFKQFIIFAFISNFIIILDF